MKLFGQAVTGPNKEVIVLPRQNYDIILTAQAILDDTSFTELCPRPKPPIILKAGTTEWTEDRTDTDWVSQLDNWARKRSAWIVIESLRATPENILSWDLVKYNDPETWLSWQKEMKEAFFTESEIVRIMNMVWAVNGMDQDKLDEARNRFLAGVVRQYKAPPSPTVEQSNTRSGEPAKDSASVPQA